MAVISQPAKKPEWNTGGSNRTEPTAGEKTSGWAINDQPPSSYFNWLQYYAFAWIDWLNQRFYKGANEVDLVIEALQPDTAGDGGELALISGQANGSNTGGDATLKTPDQVSGTCGAVLVQAGAGAAAGPTAGGALVLEAGDSYGATSGRVTIAGGDQNDSSSNIKGGDIRLWAGDTLGDGQAGEIEIYAGDSSLALGGNVEIAAGDSASGFEGADVNITAGNTVGGDGGEVNITAGDGGGVDQNAGNINIDTGQSTGTGYGQVVIDVVEGEQGGSGSGSYTNARTNYVHMNQGGGKAVAVKRYLTIDNTTGTDPARGTLRLFQKTQPTGPGKGDLYVDSSTDQLRLYDGVGYRALNGRFGTPFLTSLLSPDGTTQEVTFSQTGPIPVQFTIPANYLTTGSLMRFRCAISRSGTPADEPGLRLRLGTHASTTGVILSSVTAKSGGATLDRFTMDVEIYVVNGGSSATLETYGQFFAHDANPDWRTGQMQLANAGSLSADLTTALELYPTVYWFALGTGLQSAAIQYCSLQII